ncbi:MAG: hypothetical protein PHN90_06910 [Methanothrix sp.]|nr:hypothetical protein [Methanothrix sp.]
MPGDGLSHLHPPEPESSGDEGIGPNGRSMGWGRMTSAPSAGWPGLEAVQKQVSIFEDGYEVSWMKFAIDHCRSAPRGLKILFGCLLLSLLTWMPAAAQEENITWVGGGLYDYAELGFAVPKDLEDLVEAEALSEGNYSEGRYVVASLLMNQSRIFVLLLYPCEAPEGILDAEGLKSAIEGYSSELNQTIYNPEHLNISERSAIWGMIGNQALIVYQPSNLTVAGIFIEENVTEDVLVYFPESLQIIVNESITPLWPGYCEGAGAIAPEAVAEVGAAEPEEGMNDSSAAAEPVEPVAGAVTEPEPVVNNTANASTVEKTQADLEAVKNQFQDKFGLKV